MNLRGIEVKTTEQIQAMRKAGLVVAEALIAMGEAARPGVRTADLDTVARTVLGDHGATSSFLNYGTDFGIPPYPATVCISVDEEVVHGIPGDRRLAEGDIVSVDFGAILNGWHGDAARTFIVGGGTTPEAADLVEITRKAMWDGIAAVASAKRVGDVSAAIQASATHSGRRLGIVREYTGHGIGSAFHSGLIVPHYDAAPEYSTPIEEGMTFTIEPMLNLGTPEWTMWADDWTVVTADLRRSAQFEHTILVTATGAEILTLP